MPERPMRTIYALTGIQPEVQAYAMAKYSRSRLSMRRTVAELSAQRAEEFLESFYFQYGHRSIADLAHVAMAIENVSILAAIAVVDQQVWDGQERSTRYQDFARTGYYTPDAIAASPDAPAYVAAADALFAEYAALSKELTALLVETVGKPEAMDEGEYTRTLRARAFDVSRALLPLATITSVGQITSARTLERQISELLSSPLAEVRGVARNCARPASTRHSTPPPPPPRRSSGRSTAFTCRPTRRTPSPRSARRSTAPAQRRRSSSTLRLSPTR